MRILLIAQADSLPDRPGSDARGAARLLAGAGHEVTVLSPRYLPLDTWRGTRASVDYENGVRVVRIGLPPAPRALLGLEDRGSAPLAVRAFSSLGMPPTDGVHALSVTPGSILAKELGLRWQRPHVITAHRGEFRGARHPSSRARAIQQSVKDAAGVAATHREIADEMSQ